MLPFVTYGNTEASTTRRPSTPWTRIEVGSVTDMSSVPIRQVQDGCSAVSASFATQSRICSSVSTSGPGESSPPSIPSQAGCERILRVAWSASIHSRRSLPVER